MTRRRLIVRQVDVLPLAAALMVAVAVFAGWNPARRATRIEPTVALRYE